MPAPRISPQLSVRSSRPRGIFRYRRAVSWSVGVLLTSTLFIGEVGATQFGPFHEVDRYKAAKVKAACLLNFMKFTEWPRDTLEGADRPVQVCVFGEDRLIHEVLATLVREQRIQERRIAVREISSPPDRRISRTLFSQCHALYIDQSMDAYAASILEVLEGADILTVSDVADFAGMGGMLGLVIRDGRIQFDANPRAIQRTRIKVSSKVLSLARIVNGE